MNEFQLFAPLAPAVEVALRASIQRFGVIVPVVRDQHGRTIDGHHRARIADELGVKYTVDVREVADDDEARSLARTLNADRRHLTEEQRREAVALLAAETVAVIHGGEEEQVARHSPEAIAGALGVSKKTVQDDIAELASTSQLTRPAKTLGQDGKVRLTRRTSPKASAGKGSDGGANEVKRARNRRPINKVARDASVAVLQAARALSELRGDDRWTKYTTDIDPLTRDNIRRASQLLADVVDSIDA